MLFDDDPVAGRVRIGATRIGAAPPGFDPQQLWPLPQRLARRKLGLQLGKFIVLQLGRIVPGKGIDTLIDSLALLRRRDRIDAMLLVVGTGDDTPELTRLRNLARHLGMARHVQFAGSEGRAELRYYFGAADVCASVPWHEPRSVTPVEAMACARPVVCAVGSAVIDGVTGMLVPARDPQALAAALAHYAAQPALARAHGVAARARVEQRYSIGAMLAGYLSLYDRLARIKIKPNKVNEPCAE